MTEPQAQAGLPHLTEEAFMDFAEFVTRRLGIRMPKSKLLLMQTRLLKRLRELGIDSFEEYHVRLFEGSDSQEEQRCFIDLITTNKTDFFREPEHFHYLTNTLLSNSASSHFQVWSAGCSSGEEVWSLALTLAEHQRTTPNFDFEIIGSDISEKVLHLARDAIYEASRIQVIPLELRRRWLLRGRPPMANLIRIAPELRAKAQFRKLNLMDANYPIPGSLDLIFFRNVMIYFDQPTQLGVLERLCRHLKPGGHLFISHTETILQGQLPLDQVAPSIFRRHKTGQP